MIEKFDIDGVVLFTPKIFKDERGLFFESFNQALFNKAVGKSTLFVQDNISVSKKNVIRGLHFQKPPFAQGKLVRVIKGRVIDVAVDIRKKSLTYGKHVAVELSEENNKMLWVPEGFAHGFVALEDDTVFSYKCTNFYNNQSEDAILWNDKELNVDWKVKSPILSEKDKISQSFNTFVSPF
jgi:dTDP-4-dehydrorhamnose 3,5-epimerase